MALPKRPTSLKTTISNGGKLREWNTVQVTNWMKEVNNGLFAAYVNNALTLKLNGTDLMNLTTTDMKTKLNITIPNHITTLSAAIERLKKKSRRRNKKDRSQSPLPKTGKTKPNFDIIDTIPDYKLKQSVTEKIDNAPPKPKQKLNKAKSMAVGLGNSNDDMKSNDAIQRSQTENNRPLNVQQSIDTETLKKQLIQANVKKRDKYHHKDLGKKLWPKEKSMIVKEGWMKKRGVRRSGFKERWCVLRDNGHLYYFEKRPAVNLKTDVPQGMLDLDIVNSIKYVENEDPNTFNIKTNDRDWIFSAMSGGDLVEWMSALNKTFKAIHQ